MNRFPVNQMATLCAFDLLKRNPLKELALHDRPTAAAHALQWCSTAELLVPAVIRAEFGTPLFRTTWDKQTMTISDCQTWVLDRMEWFNDAAGVAERIGYESTQEFASDLEIKWRVVMRDLCMHPPMRVRMKWNDVLKRYRATV